LRLDALRQQVESARAIFDDGRSLGTDGTDAGAHVRHRPSDERHARRHARARLAGCRIDGAQREGGVLRQAIVVEGDAIRGALLDEADRRYGRCRDEEDDRDQMPSHDPSRAIILESK